MCHETIRIVMMMIQMMIVVPIFIYCAYVHQYIYTKAVHFFVEVRSPPGVLTDTIRRLCLCPTSSIRPAYVVSRACTDDEHECGSEPSRHARTPRLLLLLPPPFSLSLSLPLSLRVSPLSHPPLCLGTSLNTYVRCCCYVLMACN